MHSGSPFTVGGMSSSTGPHHHHTSGMNNWGNSGAQLPAGFQDSFSQSRSHYQPGYLMSSQTQNAPPGNPRVDKMPIVQTKAQILPRGQTSEFGMDSMLESTRQRQKLIDEDAPPSNSVNDIPNETGYSPRYLSRNSNQDVPSFARRPQRPASTAPQQPQPLYIIVFGYPPERYSLTVEYFQSLGAATDPDPHLEIQNCFRIGFNDPGDALRAVRKNGEVLGGSWMIGTKWADSAQAEMMLGQANSSPAPLPESSNSNNVMSVDEPSSPTRNTLSGQGTYTVGTPIRLAPSSSAFKRHATENVSTPPQTRKGAWNPMASLSAGQQSQQHLVQNANPPQGVSVTSSPNKGVLGQVSDLIFGW